MSGSENSFRDWSEWGKKNTKRIKTHAVWTVGWENHVYSTITCAVKTFKPSQMTVIDDMHLEIKEFPNEL